jgi:hypothetical protein
MCKEQTIESGVMSTAERYILKNIKNNDDKDKILRILFDIYMQNKSNESVCVGILDILSHMNIIDKQTLPISIAINGLYSQNSEIQDEAIKCIENWELEQGIYHLQLMTPTAPFLNEYRDGVIKDLKETIENCI